MSDETTKLTYESKPIGQRKKSIWTKDLIPARVKTAYYVAQVVFLVILLTIWALY